MENPVVEESRSRVVLVYGAGCSGKNTYVKENMQDGDLVIDFDAIHSAITGNESHDHNEEIFSYVYDARDQLLETFKEKGLSGTLWIIHSAPKKADRQKFVDEFGAELIFIDTDLQTCLDRAKEERPQEWQDYIVNWFNDYQPEDRSETRSEHIEVPDYVRANAQRGLDNLDRAGDGLVERTISEARSMANGSITEDKLRRLSAWIKRHRGDLQSEQVKDGEISAGVVAHWLWGSGSAEISVGSMLDGADRTIAWADREISKLDDGERTLEKINEKIFSSEPKQVRPTPTHDVRYIVNEFEARALDGSKAVISGYASVFDRSSQVLGGGFVEQIKRGAFTKTLQERGTKTSRDDIKALFNHSTDLVLGSKRAGTLRLAEDSKGLHYEVDLDLDITHHRSAFKMIERGDVTNSSFGFDVIEERWTVPDNSGDPVMREVLETRLYEVSPTPFPAYQDSSVMAERSFKGLSELSGLDLRDLIDANEQGSLKELLQQEDEKIFNADARKRRLDLLKNKTL